MYRARQRACPACDALMHEVPIAVTGGDEAAYVDLCRRCGAAFLDYFDGEPGELSRGVLEQHLAGREFESPPSKTPHTCCDCSTNLRQQRYMDGPVVWRCDSCLALFATHEALERLATYRLPDAPPQQPSLLDRVRRWFFARDDDRWPL